ncbi:hypothetical protein Naga_100187g12 [Nannochloropsis gaditana]|uniref:Uncharacterized protein n=1 Tax=Nannochloropsis gaditana TaxID=72520 RepID=W7TL03_9STRA|nr:hypothetical protein Naga_100187g12 [Nannochloropsis gaditana]
MTISPVASEQPCLFAVMHITQASTATSPWPIPDERRSLPANFQLALSRVKGYANFLVLFAAYCWAFLAPLEGHARWQIKIIIVLFTFPLLGPSYRIAFHAASAFGLSVRVPQQAWLWK